MSDYALFRAPEKRTLPFELSGDQKSTNLIVFLHGWPDTVRLWDGITEHFERDSIVLNVSYMVGDKFGIDFPDIIARLKNTIDSVDGGRGLRKIFVSHDWGSLFSYMFDKRYPNYISQHITMDVGANMNTGGKPNPRLLLSFALYQVYLAVAFLLSFLPIIGNLIANVMTYTLALWPWAWARYRNVSWPQLDARRMNYPYFYLWFGSFPPPVIRPKNEEFSLKGYRPSCPTVYLYGRDKPIMFHGQDWLDIVQNTQGSEVLQVSGGHWVMLEHREQVIDIVKRRCAAK